MKKSLAVKFKLTGQCARDVGIKPFKKWSAADRKKVGACVLKKMRAK